MDQTETFVAVVQDTVAQLETLLASGVFPPVIVRSIITKLAAVSKRGLPTAAAPVAPPPTDAFVAVGATRFSDGKVQTEETLAQAQAAEKTKAAEPAKAAPVEPKAEDKRA